MLPGASKYNLKDIKVDPKEMAHIEAIILSMKPKEERHQIVVNVNTRLNKNFYTNFD